jgi:hypothetical protein
LASVEEMLGMVAEQGHHIADQLAKLLELAGAGIIVGGILLASVVFVREGFMTSA